MIKVILTLGLTLALAVFVGCKRSPEDAPKVIGIPFAVPISSISQHMPPGEKAEQYPLIPMYGYKLQFANPDNWEIIVQDESVDDLTPHQKYTNPDLLPFPVVPLFASLCTI